MDVPLSNGGKWLMLKEIGYFYALNVATNYTYIYNKSTLHRVTYVVYTRALMYLDRCSIRVRGKIYSRILLRESYLTRVRSSTVPLPISPTVRPRRSRPLNWR